MNLFRCVFCLSVAGFVPFAGAASNQVPEAPAWYSSAAGGMMLSPDDTRATVILGQAPVAITLQGRTHYDDGLVAAWVLGRQFQTVSDASSQKTSHWRAEAELWHGRAHRTGFNAGVLKAQLHDSVRASALFFNGLLRIAATEESRWWLGAGIGYAKVELPDVSSAVSCACLRAASDNGLAAQVKLVSEWLISDDTAWFFELGYIRLSETSTRKESGSAARHAGLRSSAAAVGLRIRF